MFTPKSIFNPKMYVSGNPKFSGGSAHPCTDLRLDDCLSSLLWPESRLNQLRRMEGKIRCSKLFLPMISHILELISAISHHRTDLKLGCKTDLTPLKTDLTHLKTDLTLDRTDLTRLRTPSGTTCPCTRGSSRCRMRELASPPGGPSTRRGSWEQSRGGGPPVGRPGACSSAGNGRGAAARLTDLLLEKPSGQLSFVHSLVEKLSRAPEF